MPTRHRALTAVAALSAAVAATATSAHAQFGGPNLRGTTVGVGVNLPIGEFDELVKTGFGIALRSGVSDDAVWSGRTSFSFDTFSGNVTYSNIQFITFGFDIVRRTAGATYYFGGLGLSSARYAVRGGGTGFGSNRSEQDFLLTGGMGVNLGSDQFKSFIEFAATTVFTTDGNNAWFPVRVGLRF